MDERTIERFWSKVNRDGPVPKHMAHLGPCWLWTAYLDKNGYGTFWRGGGRHNTQAHRFSWVLEFGNAPQPGIMVLHACDNPTCVRPSHLFLGTAADNARDRDRKGRHWAPGGDDNGSRKHPEALARGERTYNARLTEAAVVHIRGSSESTAELARRFAVSFMTVKLARVGHTWKHVS